MLKNNIKTIISVSIFLAVPLIVSAKMGEMPSDISFFLKCTGLILLYLL